MWLPNRRRSANGRAVSSSAALCSGLDRARRRREKSLHLVAVGLELLAECLELAAACGVRVTLSAGQTGLGGEFGFRRSLTRRCDQHRGRGQRHDAKRASARGQDAIIADLMDLHWRLHSLSKAVGRYDIASRAKHYSIFGAIPI